MPARLAKHGRPRPHHQPQPQPLVDLDPFTDEISDGPNTTDPRSNSNPASGTPSEPPTPATPPPSRLPVLELEQDLDYYDHGNSSSYPVHHHPDLNVDEAGIEPSADTDADAEAAPPIPIPVPRSQTPLLDPPPVSHPQRPSPSPLPAPPTAPAPQDKAHNPFSYGYTPTTASPRPRAAVPRTTTTTGVRSPTPTTSTSTNTSTNTGPNANANTSTGKRFPTTLSPPLPLPLTRAVAPAVVDLGTASREFGGGGRSDRPDRRVAVVDAQHGKHGKEGEEGVLWARWDHLDIGPHQQPQQPQQQQGHHQQRPRRRLRLLFIAYPSALQIWDTTELEGISEVLRVPLGAFAAADQDGDHQGRVPAAAMGRLVSAGVLPRARGSRREVRERERGKDGGMGREEALIGLAFDSGMFVVYSLTTHRVVARVDVGSRGGGGAMGMGIDRFEANEEFIVISTLSPPTLHVLSAHTFATLAVIPDSKLAPYVAPPAGSAAAAAGMGMGMGAAAAAMGVGVVSSAGASAAAMLSSAFAGAFTSRGYGGRVPHQHQHQHLRSGAGENHRSYTDSPQGYGHTYTSDDRTYINASVADGSDGGAMYHHHQQDQATNYNVSSPPPPPPPPPLPHAVYAFSHRLLAYTSRSPSPFPVRTTTTTPLVPTTTTTTTTITAAAAIAESPTTATATAVKSVWGGMRTLGGLAVSAARGRIAGGGAGAGEGAGAGVAKFFSRSAPEYGYGYGEAETETETERERERRERRERRYSGASSSGVSSSPSPGTSAGAGVNVGQGADVDGDGARGGYFVTVVDLAPCATTGGAPETVVEFLAGKKAGGSNPVAGLSFMNDGCAVGVVPRDGQAVRVYQIRPSPSLSAEGVGVSGSSALGHAGGGDVAAGGVGAGAAGSGEAGMGSAWYVYNLRRGRTSAVVEGVAWAGDGRWAAVGTRRGTVHVFAVNPYGGRSDVRSHLEGRVRNVAGPPMPTDLAPIVRLRAGTTTNATPERPRAPLAFTFITSDESTLPPHLLPPLTSMPPPPRAQHATSRSYGSGDTDPPLSPTHARRRPTNFQDVLLFEPGDASLTLRRVTLEMRARTREQALGMGMGMGIVGGASAAAAAALGATSISLPGMGGAGRLSVSPGGAAGAGVGPFGQRQVQQLQQQQQVEVPMELVGKESTVKTWSLRKRRGGGVVRKIMEAGEEEVREGKERRGRADWLAQAELSTFSKSSKILPRPIYLSHQFSFHALGEDYHALIRRYQFDIGGVKIDVRREVQVSAYSAGGGESFVEGFAAPRDIRHRTLSSSFDEPLASALTNELEHPHAPGVLPMLPNGMPGSRPQSFRNAIPIRTIGDGMSESLGRIRREMINKVRSPRLRPHPDSSIAASVPLEFDEEDEDFLTRDGGMVGEMEMEMDVDMLDVPAESSRSRNTSRGDGDSGPTVSTPATSAHALEEEEGRGMEKAEDAWGGWSSEDKLAVEEVERFDNIDVLGLLDEEQALVKPVAETKRKGRARRRA